MPTRNNGDRPPKGKIELTWVGKENKPRLEPRILVEDPKLSMGDPNSENILIHGDNLLALKALQQEFAERVKCIFIDPPYNTGSAFAHYDDGLEHSIWLSMMRDRLEILRILLAESGSLWITIDDNECHYLKVLCDEIFGRQNFVANVIWQKKSSPQSNAVWLSDSHDHVLVYAKEKSLWRPKKLPRTEEQNAIYKHSDENDGMDENGKWYGRGPWFPGDFTISLASGQRGKQYAKTGQSSNIYEIVTPSGRRVLPAKGRAWAYTQESYERLKTDNRVTFGRTGNNKPCIKRFLSEIQDTGVVPMTVWHYNEVGENRIAAQEVKEFNPDDPFTTPKPERLLHRILTISSESKDWVLDSFAGSGTTGAVAHKMGRRWIMVELGDQSYRHIIPRLKKVIDGSDEGGISETVNWKGGGGFKFYRLAESLLVTDKDLSTARKPVYVINPKYDEKMLIRAICKIENFRYLKDNHWNGASSEHHFLYVTTSLLSQRHLDSVSAQLGEEEALLIYCTRRTSGLKVPDNIEVKKIPRDLLAKCSFEEDRV